MILTLTGPSCAGKSTLERMLVKRGFSRIVSHTTRKPRDGERDGVDYHFIDKSGFRRLTVQGYFAETTSFDGNLYGASVSSFEKNIKKGVPTVIVVEPFGAQQIRVVAKEKGWRVKSIFVNNPVSVIADRYIMRIEQSVKSALLAGRVPDLRPHAKRLATIMSVERDWERDAVESGLYDTVIDRFDESNSDAVVEQITLSLTKE